MVAVDSVTEVVFCVISTTNRTLTREESSMLFADVDQN